MKRFLALAAATLTLTSCASMLERSTQEVTFLTPGAYDSMCIIDNGELKYRTHPPQTITIPKRSGVLTVHCIADGNREQTITIPAEPQAIGIGNVFTGGAPGLFIDHETGALYEYPQTITVDFTNMVAMPMPRPKYDQFLAENPHLYGMEEFRPGDAALIRDKYYVSEPLKQRDYSEKPSFSEFTSVTEGADEIPAAAVQATPSEPAMGEVTVAPVKDVPADPRTDMISDLTRQMNPQVFGPATDAPQQAPAPAPNGSGFVGGAAQQGEAVTEPVTIYPVDEEQ